MAQAEVVRALRFLNVPLAVWIIVGPWLRSGGTSISALASLAISVALIAFRVPRRPAGQHHANWKTLHRLVVGMHATGGTLDEYPARV